ncbi:MAG TPA: hypothetical protein VJJ78_03060, partial [Candidatus Saccharimonadales bacterium]|nr:hypothetical protein [Candidatus Saccharimonadales bacterium]
HTMSWPVHDDKYLVSDKVTIVAQINGKVRAQFEMPSDSSEEAISKTALADTNVKKHLANKKVRKTIYVPGKLINFVV